MGLEDARLLCARCCGEGGADDGLDSVALRLLLLLLLLLLLPLPAPLSAEEGEEAASPLLEAGPAAQEEEDTVDDGAAVASRGDAAAVVELAWGEEAGLDGAAARGVSRRGKDDEEEVDGRCAGAATEG